MTITLKGGPRVLTLNGQQMFTSTGTPKSIINTGVEEIKQTGMPGIFKLYQSGEAQAITYEVEGLRNADKEVMALMFPGLTKNGDVIEIGTAAGADLSSTNFQLVAHLVADGTDLSNDLVIPVCVCTDPFEIAQDEKSFDKMKFVFKAMRDPTKADTDKGLLGYIGDMSDVDPPAIGTITPLHEAVDVDKDTTIVIKFDDPMSLHTLVNGAGKSFVQVIDLTSGTLVACTAAVTTVTKTNDTLTLTPGSALTYSDEIGVICPNTIYNRYGTPLVAVMKTFTVEAAP